MAEGNREPAHPGGLPCGQDNVRRGLAQRDLERRQLAIEPGVFDTQQAEVAPGQLGTFVYGFKVPMTVTSGVYRFHGDLALAMTGQQIHPEGYYHEAVCACP